MRNRVSYVMSCPAVSATPIWGIDAPHKASARPIEARWGMSAIHEEIGPGTPPSLVENDTHAQKAPTADGVLTQVGNANTHSC